MKRLVVSIAALSLLLTGCGQTRGIYSNYRAIEELLLVRTMGIDADGAQLVVSAAAGRPQGGRPTLLRRSAVSIPQGMEALQSRTPRGRLYFAHSQFLVLGQAWAERGIGALLDYIERDVHTRMGAALFVVRGGTAEALITGSGEDWDVNDVLATVRTGTAHHGGCHVFDLRETAVRLSEYGAALICALRCVDTEGSVFALPEGRAAVADGYGILRGGALIGFLDETEAAAASAMLGVLGTVTREIPDGRGGTVTLGLRCGAPTFSLTRTERGTALSVRLAPEAAIAALDTERPVTDAAGVAALSSAVSETLCGELAQVLARSRAEDADFLALGRALRTLGVDPAALPQDWLQTLPVRISVEATLRQSYDMEARAGTDGGGSA